jgi:Fe-S-cluster containining protein
MVTDSLGNILKMITSNMSYTDKMRMADQVEKEMDLAENYSKAFSVETRPDMEHLAIDTILGSKYPEITSQSSCKKGCSGCCYLYVLPTSAEARQLAGMINRGEVEVDRGLLEEQSAFTGTSDDWWGLPTEKKKCIFLKDGQCSVYDKRPTVCRKYFVRSDPSICSPENKDLESIPEALGIIQIESIVSGFANLDKNEEPLPVAIFRYIKKQ